MKHRSVDIAVVVSLTIIAVALIFIAIPESVPIRFLTLPLVLVLPGYALISAIFPRRSLGVPERLVFSLGLSMVIVILGGLVLNWTSFGLHASSWAVLLACITLGASAVALIRRRGQSISTSGWLGVGDIGLTFRQGLLLGLAVLIVCGAGVVSIIGAEQQPHPFTQLWILPPDGTSPKDSVQLGVSNMELTAMEYHLDVNVDHKVVKEWPSISLKPNEKWETMLILPSTGHAGTVRVEALLYRANVPRTIYRNVVLWLGT